MADKVTGQCNCGDITFTAPKTPDMTYLCACDMCRKQSSSPTGQLIYVYAKPGERMDIKDPKGLLKKYTYNKTDSGKPRTDMFCSQCGTLMFGHFELYGDYYSVRTSLIEGWENEEINLTDYGFKQNLDTKLCKLIKETI